MTSAGRRRRVDPRVVLGLILVVASVVGVLAVLRAADRTVTLYRAGSVIAAGERVDADDLAAIRVRLGGLEGRYLASGAVPAGGLVATRSIGAGELIPRSAVSARSASATTAVVIALDSPVSRAVTEGALVDVWASADVGPGERTAAPVVLASGVLVVRAEQTRGVLGEGGGARIEVRVPARRVAAVLQAQANGDTFGVLPAVVGQRLGATPTPTATPTPAPGAPGAG